MQIDYGIVINITHTQYNLGYLRVSLVTWEFDFRSPYLEIQHWIGYVIEVQ